MNDYFKDLGMIYENLDFQSSYDDYDNLKGMFERLRPTLAQYSEFTRN
jgi:hypothetical protein